MMPTAIGSWQVFHDTQRLHRLSWFGWEADNHDNLSFFTRIIKRSVNSYANTGYLDKSMVPLQLDVSPFQERVLEQLNEIPCGQTRTYGEIAKILNSSARAVGQACRTNPLPLFIPCHRIVSKTDIGGYMGKTNQTDLKSLLLNQEAKLSQSN